MSGLFLPRRWTRQPQGPVEIDWGNPITRGISFVVAANMRQPLMRGTLDSLSTSPPTAFSSELALGGQANGSLNCDIPYINKSALVDSPTTILLRIRRRYAGIWFSAGAVAIGYQNTTPQTWDFGFSGDPFTFSSRDATNTGYTVTDSSSVPLDRLSVYFGEVTDTTLSIFRGAALIADTPFTGGILTGYNGANVAAGLRVNTDRNDLCDIEKLVFWKRALEDGERRALVENSHIIYRPRRPILYFLPVTNVLFDKLNEVTPDDSNYVTASEPSTFRVTLTSIVDPGVHTGHSIPFRAKRTGTGLGLSVKLMLGDTTLQTWVSGIDFTLTDEFQTFELTLSESNAADITDYSAVELEVESVST